MLFIMVEPLAVTKGINVEIVSTRIHFIIARTRKQKKESGLNYGLQKVILLGS